MGRVKNYNTFLKENLLTSHVASKKMEKILDPDSSKSVRAKSKSEIEASFGKDTSVWDSFSWVDDKNGYVGKSPIFSGEVVLREIDDDGSIVRTYEVINGTNSGLSGNFSWEGESGMNKKYPKFNPPGEKWSDVLGPDENFLKTFVSAGYRWGSNISEIDGIKIVKVNEKGVCEIEYEDRYQFYGNVRIYYLGNTGSDFFNSYYSYEVKDGPNKGTKGTGISIFSEEQAKLKTGIYNPFSNGDNPLSVIQYPPTDANSDKDISSGSNKGKGISDFQLIFLNTSTLSLIKAPTNEGFYDLYPGANSEYSEAKAFKAFENKNSLKNTIFGKLDKNKLSGKKVYTFKGGKITYFNAKDLSPLDKLDGNTSGECYVSHYQGNPLLLYTVSCKDKDSPSFDNKGVGTYGNNFFTGVFFSGDESNPWIPAKGEWYYDYSLDQIGIIYAYDCNTKKEIGIIKNLAAFEIESTPVDFTDPKNPTGIVKDQSGGSWPTPMKPKELNIPSIDDYFKKK